MAQFTTEERALIQSILDAYKQFSTDSYTRIWLERIGKRLDDDKLLPKDFKYLYMYAENLAAQTVDILINGPEEWKGECRMINEKLVILLLKLKSFNNLPDYNSPLYESPRRQ